MTIAVYCSAKDQISEDYLQLGDELGRWIGRNGHTLLYGGATGGLMTRVSNAAREAGAEVIGVVPQRIIRAGRKADNCHRLYEVRDMCIRKRSMRNLADCFVCLPGSYGTLDEMMDVIASGTVGEHHKRVAVLNYQGFYDGLIQQIEHMKALHFLPKEETCKPIMTTCMDELTQLLSDWSDQLHKHEITIKQ